MNRKYLHKKTIKKVALLVSVIAGLGIQIPVSAVHVDVAELSSKEMSESWLIGSSDSDLPDIDTDMDMDSLEIFGDIDFNEDIGAPSEGEETVGTIPEISDDIIIEEIEIVSTNDVKLPEKEIAKLAEETAEEIKEKKKKELLALFPEGFAVDPSKYPAANMNQNSRYIHQYLVREMGLNHAAACGVLANIHLESSFNPLAFGDGGTSYGICQWHLGRFSGLVNYGRQNGLDYNTLDGQLAYLRYELENGYPGVLNYIKSVPNTVQGARNAARYWCIYFESPDNMYLRGEQRGNLAANEYFPRNFDSDDMELQEEQMQSNRTNPFLGDEKIQKALKLSLLPYMINIL